MSKSISCLRIEASNPLTLEFTTNELPLTPRCIKNSCLDLHVQNSDSNDIKMGSYSEDDISITIDENAIKHSNGSKVASKLSSHDT